MADSNFTVSDGATDSELAERFPINCDPFSVWFNAEVTPGQWAVNDETGDASIEAVNYETAVKVASALKEAHAREAIKGTCIEAKQNQIEIALEQIAHMAMSVSQLCTIAGGGDSGGYMAYAARHLANKIGWTADRCLGFDIQESDDWLLPPAWEREAKKAANLHLD